MLAIYAYRALIYDDLFTNTSVHLVSNICISFQIVFLSFHVRMFRYKRHFVSTWQHVTRTVSTTVYGIYVFWLQGIYTRESFASTWVHPRFVGGSVLLICLAFCGVFLFCLSSLCVLCAQCCHFFWTDPSVFSTVYLLPTVFHVSYVPNVASFSGYFILDCPFGFL